MYLAYCDESGTSPNQPVTVVVAIVLDADKHWREAERRLIEILDQHVPEDLREGFIFHATDIWSKYPDHPDWSRAQRNDLIERVAAIPKDLGLGIALGKVRRDVDYAFPQTPREKADLQHFIAFGDCIALFDRFIRENGHDSAVGIVIAEDVESKNAVLRKAMRVKRTPLSPENLLLTRQERETGVLRQRPLRGGIDRIVDTIHFVGKKQGPLLQIADACAYSFRRFFSQERGGIELARAVLGRDLHFEDWASVHSYEFFNFGLRTINRHGFRSFGTWGQA